MNLWQDFMTNDQKVIHKWAHYFPIYERHFSRWRNQSLVFWEVGVYGGGSLQMWQRYFGPNAIIIGIDINPKCKVHESPGIHVRIGNQMDTRFLASVIDEFGPPDVVLDDGSHHMEPTWALFEFVYPKVPKNGVYMVEDMHTSYWPKWGGGLNVERSFINRSKKLIDELNADHTKGELAPTDFTRTTGSICFYDSIVVFEKGNTQWKAGFRTGDKELIRSIDQPKAPPQAKPSPEPVAPPQPDASLQSNAPPQAKASPPKKTAPRAKASPQRKTSAQAKGSPLPKSSPETKTSRRSKAPGTKASRTKASRQGKPSPRSKKGK